MNERSLTPNITVTIGHHTRIYFAFVTTAPAELDSPATVTLHGALFAEMAGFAADRARRLVASPRAMRWINRTTGGVMAGAAAAIATRS